MVHTPNPYRNISEQLEPAATKRTSKIRVLAENFCDWVASNIGMMLTVLAIGSVIGIGVILAKKDAICKSSALVINEGKEKRIECHPDAELIVNHAVIECRCKTNKVEK